MSEPGEPKLPRFREGQMAEPAHIAQISIQNPHATRGMTLDIRILSNTPSDEINRNVRTNAARDLDWLMVSPPHDRPVLIVGGGPSAADTVAEIRAMHANGALLMALNGASHWLRERGITPDIQFMIDAKQETATLVDPLARRHLFASQMHPSAFDRVSNPTLVHLLTAGIEDQIPHERRQRGGYCYIGGGIASGNSALCAAYAMGHRVMHCFGFDCSNRGEATHAYAQPMNAGELSVMTEWDGMSYQSSIAMRVAADTFLRLASELETNGVRITLHGSGLLPAMYRARNKCS